MSNSENLAVLAAVETVQPANKSESRCVILSVRISIHARIRRTNLFSIPICAQFRPVQRPCYLAPAAESWAHTPTRKREMVLSFSLHSFFSSIFSQPPTAGGYIGIHLSRSRISSYSAHRRPVIDHFNRQRSSLPPPCVCNKRMSLNGPARKIPRQHLPPRGCFFLSVLPAPGAARTRFCVHA
jgi:hypothetical protein